MDSRIPLYFTKHPYDISGTEKYFMRAIRENFSYHILHNPDYAEIVRRELGFKRRGRGELAEEAASLIRVEEDISLIPHIPTAFFKKKRLWTMKPWQLPVKATSSGTEGKRSEMAYDCQSIIFGAALAGKLCSFHGLFSLRPANYIILGYEPHRTNKTVITKTQFISSFFAPPIRRSYALKYGEGGYTLNKKGLIRDLMSFCRSGFPVRIIGFPAYFFFLLKTLDRAGIRMKLPEGSMVLLGGGWKKFEGSKVDIIELSGLAQKVLGIKPESIREFFGAAEHPGLYCSCKNHHFHVPCYSRVIIRDETSLKPLDYGEPGLLNLITPIAHSIPLISVMTDDIAVLHRGEDCGCGIKTDYFEIVKRVGLSEIETCSQTADSLMRDK